MLPLPKPRSSKLTVSDPLLLTEPSALWNFAATADAGSALTMERQNTAARTAATCRNLKGNMRVTFQFGEVSEVPLRFANPETTYSTPDRVHRQQHLCHQLFTVGTRPAKCEVVP